MLKAIRRKTIATQTVEEEQEAKEDSLEDLEIDGPPPFVIRGFKQKHHRKKGENIKNIDHDQDGMEKRMENPNKDQERVTTPDLCRAIMNLGVKADDEKDVTQPRETDNESKNDSDDSELHSYLSSSSSCP